MKYFKRLVFIVLFAFSALLLASCVGAGSNDNGVYVFEPTSEEILEMVEKETETNSVAKLFVNQLKIKWSEEDPEKKITYKIEGDVLTLENPNLDIGDKNTATFLKSVKFKRSSSHTSKGGTS